MRLVALYLRGRGVPVALLVVAGLSVLAARTAVWLVGQPQFDEMARLPVAVAAALAAAVVLAATLRAPAAEIEAATPTRWHHWQAGHVMAALLAGAGLLVPALPMSSYGAGVLLRDLVGLLGLALLTAMALGPQLAWTVPSAYTAVVYFSAGADQGALRSIWAFPQQPADSAPALITALTVGVAGLIGWGVAGPVALAIGARNRRSYTSETRPYRAHYSRVRRRTGAGC